MWMILSILAILVNAFLTLASGAGGLQGAAGIGYIAGSVVGFPAAVGAILAVAPSNRNMKSFWKAFFWTSVLNGIVLLSKVGQAVQESGQVS